MSIVAISQRIRAWYRETVAAYGFSGRLASIRALDEPLADIGQVQDTQADRLVALAARCVADDGRRRHRAGRRTAGRTGTQRA